MTNRRPLVLINGSPLQLQDGDVLEIDGTVLATAFVGDGSGLTNTGVSGINNVTYQWEFLATATAADAWLGAAISGGNNSGTAPLGTPSMNANSHPGVLTLRSSTTANSGYRYLTGILRSYMDSKFACISATAEYSTTVALMGFFNTTDSSEPSNGIYFRLSGTSLQAICRTSDVTTSVTLGTIEQFTFYHYQIVTDEGSSIFTVTNDAGTVLFTTTISTNVPDVVSLQCGVVAWDTAGGSATHVMYPDYLRLELKNLGRG